MTKEKIIKIYYYFSVFIALGMLVSMYLFLGQFPEFMNGVISRTLFNLDFEFAGESEYVIEVFNAMFVIFFLVLIINVNIMIYVLRNEKVDNSLVEGIFYNTIISLVLIIAHLTFYYQIPTLINGNLEHYFFHSNFFLLSTNKVVVYNLSYGLIMLYLINNFYVNYKIFTKVERLEENKK